MKILLIALGVIATLALAAYGFLRLLHWAAMEDAKENPDRRVMYPESDRSHSGPSPRSNHGTTGTFSG